jgi:hypothetical protein
LNKHTDNFLFLIFYLFPQIQYIGAGDTVHQCIDVNRARLHQYIGGKLQVPEIDKEKQTGRTNNPILRTFLMLAASIYRCKMISSTVALLHYKGN